MTRSPLTYLQTEHDWPEGWHLQPHYGPRVTCMGNHKIAPGHRLYLTGEPGEAFCTLHAPIEKVDQLARQLAPLPKDGVMGKRRAG